MTDFVAAPAGPQLNFRLRTIVGVVAGLLAVPAGLELSTLGRCDNLPLMHSGRGEVNNILIKCSRVNVVDLPPPDKEVDDVLDNSSSSEIRPDGLGTENIVG